MGHGHSHKDHHDHGTADRRALTVALILTAGYTVVEVVGGFLTGSLALLSDAAHMLSDNVAISLALFAAWLAAKPPTPEKSFGYRRAEILAALANGVTLVAVAIWIFVEAARRIGQPNEILGGWMLAIATVGLAVNLAAAAVLARGRNGNLNLEATFRHVLADLAGSVGVIVAAILVITRGWTLADPVISIVVGLLVLFSSWHLLRSATRVLLEAAPEGIDVQAVGERLASAPGVVQVHDLHIWTITSGFPALSAHVLVGPDEDCHGRCRDLEHLLAHEFDITHATLKVDHLAERGDFVPLDRIARRSG